MAMVRVWNITDDTNPDVKPHNRMVLGKVLKPGQAVKVDEARLARAHKVHKDVKAGYLHIGNQPPVSYTSVKKPPRAKADARRVDEHGKAKGQPVAPAHGHGNAEAPVLEVKDEVAVTEEVAAELKPAEEAAPAEETPAEESAAEPEEEATETKKSGSRKRRGR